MTDHKRHLLPFVLLVLFVLLVSPSITRAQGETHISQQAIDALVCTSLGEAAIALRDQPTTAKSLYLLREVTRIVMHEASKKHPRHSEAHQYYQNLGIAYHNLFLFLKARGYGQEKFFKRALKFYKKSKRYATPLHKQETGVLIAALFQAHGDNLKAEKMISKAAPPALTPDYQMHEYLAAYYAAKGDTEEAIKFLKLAYRGKPAVILTWLVVGDDFYLIKDDPNFTALLNEWHFARKKKQLEFTLPPPSQPKLQFAEPTIKFRKSVLTHKKTRHHKKRSINRR